MVMVEVLAFVGEVGPRFSSKQHFIPTPFFPFRPTLLSTLSGLRRPASYNRNYQLSLLFLAYEFILLQSFRRELFQFP